MLSNEHEARVSQPEVAEVGQEELRNVVGGVTWPINIPVSWQAKLVDRIDLPKCFVDYPW